MQNRLDDFARIIRSKLKPGHPTPPSAAIIRSLLNAAYGATLHTEEGQFVRGSLTFANPADPDTSPPIRRRAAYPSFSAFDSSFPLTVETVVKLSRAVDRWSASIAVYGRSVATLCLWGVVDQILEESRSLHRENCYGFGNPGLFTIKMEGIAQISVYRGYLFLGAIRHDRLVRREHDALSSTMIERRITPALRPVAAQIVRAIEPRCDIKEVLSFLLHRWSSTVARLCIGLRRMGTGGTFLITPEPHTDHLYIANSFTYSRIRDAIALGVLESQQLSACRHHRSRLWSEDFFKSMPVPELVEELFQDRMDEIDEHGAKMDEEDRNIELDGATKLVTTLAGADGLVLLDPLLSVQAFGVKIELDSEIGSVRDAAGYVRRGAKAEQTSISQLGTRHRSVLRYCRLDRSAIGVVVSQDGHVRVVTSVRNNLLMWQDVKLLNYSSDARDYVTEENAQIAFRERYEGGEKRGYTATPKTFAELMRLKKG